MIDCEALLDSPQFPEDSRDVEFDIENLEPQGGDCLLIPRQKIPVVTQGLFQMPRGEADLFGGQSFVDIRQPSIRQTGQVGLWRSILSGTINASIAIRRSSEFAPSRKAML